MTPRILFISHSAYRSGAPIILLNLLRWLKENRNYQIEILLKSGGILETEYRKLAPVYLYSPVQARNGWSNSLASRLRLLDLFFLLRKYRCIKKLRNSKYSLVYSNTITNGRLLHELRELRCPVICHVHELDYWIEQSGRQNLEYIKRYTTQYISVSEKVKRNLIERYGIAENLIDVVYGFVPAVDELIDYESQAKGIHQQLNIPVDAFVVGGTGQETWLKGKDLFVQLAYLVSDKSHGRPIHFIWIGADQGKDEQYRIMHDVHRLGLEKNIHFTGEVLNPLSYFSACDVFTLISREDSFPLACLEAASLGKPILCFNDAGGMPEFVDEDAGFIVPYLDLNDMSDKIIKLMDDEHLRLDLGKRAAMKVRNRHEVSIAAPQITNIIDRLIGNH